MALVEDPRSIYIPELGDDITFIDNAILRGRMSGLFTAKILYKQHGDVHKVVFPGSGYYGVQSHRVHRDFELFLSMGSVFSVANGFFTHLFRHSLFPYGYIFTSNRDTICSFYYVADTDIAMVPAGVRTNLQWLLKNVQSFSAALILVNMGASSVNEYALKLKSSSIAGNYA